MHHNPLTPDQVEALAGRIKAAREGAGLTQREAAAALGVSQPRWADIEAGRKPPYLDTILAIAEALGADPHELDPRLASHRPRRR